jgi:hypothetical protein
MSEKDWTLLLSRIKEGNCTPFLGAGASHPLPLAREIALHWSDKFNYPLYDRENLPGVARYLSIHHDSMFPKDEMRRYLQQILQEKGNPNFNDPCQIHRVLAKLPLPVYLTTNYDDFMTKALQLERKQVSTDYCRWNSLIEKEPGRIDNNFEPTVEQPLVYHLHGTLSSVDSIVLTEDDYIEFLGKIDREKLHHRIVRAFAGTSLLFLGYSLEDFNFRTIFKGLIDTAGRGLRRSSISVQLPPKKQAKDHVTAILQTIKKLAEQLYHDMANDQRKIEAIVEEIEQRVVDETVYSIITKLENELNMLAADYEKRSQAAPAKSPDDQGSGIFRKVINQINLLQNAVERFHRAVNVKDFLEEYFKGMNISIYWGRVDEFARELREKCVQEKII